MSAAVELHFLGKKAADALAQIRDSVIQGPAKALRKSCEDAERAWSGSNIGYHAATYCQGLRAKAPHAQFSAEWGLGDHWPTYQPDPCWETMDKQEVIDQILKRAGVDAEEIEANLATLRDAFEELKDNAVCILSAAQKNKPDAFLQKKLSEIEQLQAENPFQIALGLLPRGQVWSRDSLAMSQGIQLAPHQQLSAVPMSAVELENSIDQLEKLSKLSASYLQRLEPGNQTLESSRMTVFIGHGASLVWRELKDFLSNRLKLEVEEFNSVSVAGMATVDRLSEMLKKASFAFLVMTAEDETPTGKLNARLNVIHEVGLFQGRLGFNKAIVLLEDGCEEFSNIRGLGQIRFPRGQITAKSEDIRAVLEREGLIKF